VTTRKDSQITNDPNDYSREVGDPRSFTVRQQRTFSSELPLFWRTAK
jgi:hypothetical protein